MTDFTQVTVTWNESTTVPGTGVSIDSIASGSIPSNTKSATGYIIPTTDSAVVALCQLVVSDVIYIPASAVVSNSVGAPPEPAQTEPIHIDPLTGQPTV